MILQFTVKQVLDSIHPDFPILVEYQVKASISKKEEVSILEIKGRCLPGSVPGTEWDELKIPTEHNEDQRKALSYFQESARIELYKRQRNS